MAHPYDYIAQPTLALSTCPTFVNQRGAAPRRSAALRAVGQGHHHRARRLTGVALKDGSLVVNSSQGGGTKDTWVLGPDGEEPEETQSQSQSQS